MPTRITKETHMKSTLKNILCQFLIIATAMLPFSSGQASMIPTDQAMSSQSVQADRTTVQNFFNRAETTTQLQSMGIDAQTAQNRVASMTDDEVGTLAGKINAMPVGADGGLALIILLVFFIWYFAFRR
jgi:hypothetical protein